MDNKKIDSKIASYAGIHLGKSNCYKETYSPELLVKIPRIYNRELYNISNEKLPFVGYDIWNAYEVSFLTQKKLPINGVLKIQIPANSEFIVESKSLKLYLNSFNMTTLGTNTDTSIGNFCRMVCEDLSNLLDSSIECKFYRENLTPINVMSDYVNLSAIVDLDTIEFSLDSDDINLLVDHVSDDTSTIRLQTDLLRSNCRVTNQPDWGDVFIHIKGNHIPDYESLIKFIVSHRKINHFHEEVVEMLYTKLFSAYKPCELMVFCFYTRRGGIDINPVRASNESLIPPALRCIDIIASKTIRQ